MIFKTRIQSPSILTYSKNVTTLRLHHNLSCACHGTFSSGRLSNQTGQQQANTVHNEKVVAPVLLKVASGIVPEQREEFVREEKCMFWFRCQRIGQIF